MSEAEKVLAALCETIEATGGLIVRKSSWGNDVVAPAGDEDWSDLADIYLDACRVLKREPQYKKDSFGEE